MNPTMVAPRTRTRVRVRVRVRKARPAARPMRTLTQQSVMRMLRRYPVMRTVMRRLPRSWAMWTLSR